jgi:hypothetical protein
MMGKNPGFNDDKLRADKRAVDDARNTKTAQLKSKRLAKETADREQRDEAIPEGRLNASNDT